MMLRTISFPSMASNEACRKRSGDKGRRRRDWTPCEAKVQQVPRKKRPMDGRRIECHDAQSARAVRPAER